MRRTHKLLALALAIGPFFHLGATESPTTAPPLRLEWGSIPDSSLIKAILPPDLKNENNILNITQSALKYNYLNICFPQSKAALRRLLYRLGEKGAFFSWVISGASPLCTQHIIAAKNRDKVSPELGLMTLKTLYKYCRYAGDWDGCIWCLLRDRLPFPIPNLFPQDCNIHLSPDEDAAAYAAIADSAQWFLAEIFNVNSPAYSYRERAGIRTHSRLLSEKLFRYFLASASSFEEIRQAYEAYGNVAIVVAPWVNEMQDGQEER